MNVIVKSVLQKTASNASEKGELMIPRLIILSNRRWAEKTDIVGYAQRQAQSCKYLEALFTSIINKAGDFVASISELFRHLTEVHQRQYNDLAQLVHIPEVTQRRSFYFDTLYATFDLIPSALPEQLTKEELMTVLAIQGVAYLRGHDRYRVLQDYDVEVNVPFIAVWNCFYHDAKANAEHVFACLQGDFYDERSEQLIQQILIAEDALMQTIWEYHHIPPS